MARMLAKVAIERVLETEIEEHLGEKSNGRRKNRNSRNGYSPKTLKTDTAEIPLEIPRDRNLTSSRSWRKRTSVAAMIWIARSSSLYARGMTTRDITDIF